MPRRRARRLLVHLALLLALPASGVVIDTGDGSGNTGPPADDPGFANVGVSSNALSGVFVGNRWVLTAYHVGDATSFSFGGVPYASMPGSRVRLETSPSVGADLALIRLAGDPPLPALVVAETPPAMDEEATLVGNGRSRAPSLTCWDAGFNPVSCGPGPPPTYTGYLASGPRAVRWGRNLVSLPPYSATIPGSGTSQVFETRFDTSGVTHESQVVAGDSGGAVFLKRGSQWELVGILIAQGNVFPGQPANTAVFGNDSVMVDVSFYADQIDAIVNPPFTVPLASGLGLLGLSAGLALVARRVLHRA